MNNNVSPQRKQVTEYSLFVFLFFQGDCWICMELMATSLDKFYKFVYGSLDDVIPEEILGKITLAVSFLDSSLPYFIHIRSPIIVLLS